MPISVQPDHLFTVSELQSFLEANGDRSPKRTLRKLQDAGLTIRAGKLILGKDLLAALDSLGEVEAKPSSRAEAVSKISDRDAKHA